MRPLLFTSITALLLLGSASRPVPKIDPLAAMYETARLEQDVVYRSVNGIDLPLDIFLPEKRLGQSPWWEKDGRGNKPTLLYMHGGGWVQGDKESILFNILPFIARDWVVISINYRLAKDAKAPAAVEDCLAALDWVYDHAEEYMIDTDRIVVAGDSAGGHLALLTGMLRKGDSLCENKLIVGEKQSVAAIINWVGVTDLSTHDIPQQWIDPADNRTELIRSLSPIHYVRTGGTPVISVHGSDDPVVLPNQAKSLHEKLQTAGVKEKLVMISGAKHGNFSPQESTFMYSEIWNFLESIGIQTTVD